MLRTLLSTIALLAVLAGCGNAGDHEARPEPAPTTATSDEQVGAPVSTAQPPSTTSPADEPDGIAGTIVRFASSDVQVDVTITQDNPTVRDFLSLLPLTMRFEEFSGREKIGYPPRRLVTEGSPGHDSENGDLIYFTPWGNLGFYYNAEGIEHDDRVIGLGTYRATADELAGLEDGDVSVTVVG